MSSRVHEEELSVVDGNGVRHRVIRRTALQADPINPWAFRACEPTYRMDTGEVLEQTSEGRLVIKGTRRFVRLLDPQDAPDTQSE